MADTTAINTGKKSGVNKRLQDYIMENVGHDIHTLECLFHVNEYTSRMWCHWLKG